MCHSIRVLGFKNNIELNDLNNLLEIKGFYSAKSGNTIFLRTKRLEEVKNIIKKYNKKLSIEESLSKNLSSV